LPHLKPAAAGPVQPGAAGAREVAEVVGAAWRIPRRAALSSLAASRRAGEEQPLPGVGEVVAELPG